MGELLNEFDSNQIFETEIYNQIFENEENSFLNEAFDQFGQELDESFSQAFDKLEISMKSFADVPKAFTNEKEKVTDFYRKKKKAVLDKTKTVLNKERVNRKLKSHRVYSILTKIAFLVGVFGLMISEAIFFNKPLWFPKFYTIITFPLMILRYFFYKKVNHHYFMLDFCYWVNFLIFVFLYLYQNPLFFLMIFVNANGPVLSGVCFWQNSLVFHSLDKITSLFLHIFPSLVTFILRWKMHGNAICFPQDCNVSLWQSIGFSFVLYLIWQILYFIKTEIVNESKRDKEKLMTSFIWQKTHNGMRDKLLLQFPEKYHVFIYMFYQSIYHIVTMIPAKYMYQHKKVHVIAIVFELVISVINAASYYFDFVPTRTRFALDKRTDKRKKKISSTKTD
ncbi:hypothetical protein M0813_23962 [Anaeramoeba flamelloides]|uniref:Glycerophosphocholine acyltransferase 1 n=1 Tax=Anaeramoeba flamelloides TaxID=1746091 RepID=A0AAV7Z7U3_9EUKA|nr:hypothetical protein M0812_17331 [Anaeramoeba flamelloides]KAJ6240863.1 hypothetical protein M0813_23962 [Anaeramoeba flamelloides]